MFKKQLSVCIFPFCQQKEIVYVDPPKICTSVNETQTETTKLLNKYVLTDPIEEPEPEKPELADVTIQTDEEPVTPVSDVDTQTLGPQMSDSHIQTETVETANAEVQADEVCCVVHTEGEVKSSSSTTALSAKKKGSEGERKG